MIEEQKTPITEKKFYEPDGEYTVQGLDHQIMLGDDLLEGIVKFKILSASEDFQGHYALTGGKIEAGELYALLGENEVPVSMEVLQHLVAGKVVLRINQRRPEKVTFPPKKIRIESAPSINTLFQQLAQVRAEATRLLTEKVQRDIAHMHPVDRVSPHITGLGSYSEAIQRLAVLEEDQYRLMKLIAAEGISLFQSKHQIPNNQLDCVYWAGGHDRFTRRMPGYWKSIGMEGEENPINIKIWGGLPQQIKFDVNRMGFPAHVGESSTAVALFKTLGSAPPGVSDRFWRKIVQTHKLGGLLITSDEIPREYRHLYKPFLLGSEPDSNKIEIENPGIQFMIDGGYVPGSLSFWVKSKLHGEFLPELVLNI